MSDVLCPNCHQPVKIIHRFENCPDVCTAVCLPCNLIGWDRPNEELAARSFALGERYYVEQSNVNEIKLYLTLIFAKQELKAIADNEVEPLMAKRAANALLKLEEMER